MPDLYTLEGRETLRQLCRAGKLSFLKTRHALLQALDRLDTLSLERVEADLERDNYRTQILAYQERYERTAASGTSGITGLIQRAQRAEQRAAELEGRLHTKTAVADAFKDALTSDYRPHKSENEALRTATTALSEQVEELIVRAEKAENRVRDLEQHVTLVEKLLPEGAGLHTVTIVQDEHDLVPRIEFTCHGDRTSDCHNYPDCACEEWELDFYGDHEHPSKTHDRCWMQDWFVNDGIDPCTDTLMEAGYRPGMSGPIKTAFCHDYIEWEFTTLPPDPEDEEE